MVPDTKHHSPSTTAREYPAVFSKGEPVEISFQWRPQLTDAGDEMVLEAAINGRADVLVTHNVRDFAKGAQKFGLRVLRPGELLKELRS